MRSNEERKTQKVPLSDSETNGSKVTINHYD